MMKIIILTTLGTIVTITRKVTGAVSLYVI